MSRYKVGDPEMQKTLEKFEKMTLEESTLDTIKTLQAMRKTLEEGLAAAKDDKTKKAMTKSLKDNAAQIASFEKLSKKIQKKS